MTLKEAEELTRKVDNILKAMLWFYGKIAFPVYIIWAILYLLYHVFKEK